MSQKGGRECSNSSGAQVRMNLMTLTDEFGRVCLMESHFSDCRSEASEASETSRRNSVAHRVSPLRIRENGDGLSTRVLAYCSAVFRDRVNSGSNSRCPDRMTTS